MGTGTGTGTVSGTVARTVSGTVARTVRVQGQCRYRASTGTGPVRVQVQGQCGCRYRVRYRTRVPYPITRPWCTHYPTRYPYPTTRYPYTGMTRPSGTLVTPGRAGFDTFDQLGAVPGCRFWPVPCFRALRTWPWYMGGHAKGAQGPAKAPAEGSRPRTSSEELVTVLDLLRRVGDSSGPPKSKTSLFGRTS